VPCRVHASSDRSSRHLRNDIGFGVKVFFKIMLLPQPIDNKKIAYTLKCHQRMMPDICAVIHTLVATRQENLRYSRLSTFVFGDNDQPFTTGKRLKALASERMTLHHIDAIGQLSRLAAEDVEDHLRVRAQRLGPAQGMI